MTPPDGPGKVVVVVEMTREEAEAFGSCLCALPDCLACHSEQVAETRFRDAINAALARREGERPFVRWATYIDGHEELWLTETMAERHRVSYKLSIEAGTQACP